MLFIPCFQLIMAAGVGPGFSRSAVGLGVVENVRDPRAGDGLAGGGISHGAADDRVRIRTIPEIEAGNDGENPEHGRNGQSRQLPPAPPRR